MFIIVKHDLFRTLCNGILVYTCIAGIDVRVVLCSYNSVVCVTVFAACIAYENYNSNLALVF